MEMKKSGMSAIEYRIREFIENLKKQTSVSIADLEKFYDLGISLMTKIEELRNSRDNWRVKYETLRLAKENS